MMYQFKVRKFQLDSMSCFWIVEEKHEGGSNCPPLPSPPLISSQIGLKDQGRRCIIKLFMGVRVMTPSRTPKSIPAFTPPPPPFKLFQNRFLNFPHHPISNIFHRLKKCKWLQKLAHYLRNFGETLAKEVKFVTSPGLLGNRQIIKSTMTKVHLSRSVYLKQVKSSMLVPIIYHLCSYF